jgi:hypothetical protein
VFQFQNSIVVFDTAGTPTDQPKHYVMQASDEPLLPVARSSGAKSLLDRVKEHNWCSPKAKRLFLARAVLILLLVVMAVANSLTGMMLPHTQVECLTDATFEATADITAFLRDNLVYRDALIVFASALMDAVMIISVGRFLLLAQTWRPILSLLVFYLVRGMVMSLFQLRFPDGYLWDYPGFPSIIVPYAKTSDFFFSGHMGFATIALLENYEYKHYSLVALAAFTLVVESVVMVVTRGHYCIDIIAGVVFAHYIWMLTGYFSPVVDRKLVEKKGNEDAFVSSDFSISL